MMHSGTGEGENLSLSTSSHPCRRFSLAEIQFATKDFDDDLIIGHGGFGKVYKGQISIEEVVAIKRLDSMSDQGATEFKAEIETLSTLRHCNLVSLIGYCDDNKEMILVYTYMPNGTLYHHLHKSDTALNWVLRLKIALGAARGLDYLHTGVGSKHGIIHRDVKSSNILLDENWTAMISDFGLSKISPTNQSFSYIDASVKGTFGYLDPEYFYTRRLTRKTDVFAFGVVLFELLSGRLPVDIQYGEEQCSLVRWAQKCVKQRKLDQMIDPNMRETIFPKCLRQFVEIANHCLISVPKERPTMTQVVASLQAIEELQAKYTSSANSLDTMGFTWKIHKYIVFATKQTSDQHERSSLKSLENNMNQSSSSTNMDSSLKSLENSMNQRSSSINRDLKLFSYSELELATGSFRSDTFLGYGSYGKVYKGWVDNTTYSPCENSTGLPIIVKILYDNKFFDLERMKKFSHPNLVKLIGYCSKEHQHFLVYEFMVNGSFDDLLNTGGIARIPWVTKVKIAVGIAQAIVFLLKLEGNVTRKDQDELMPLLHRNKIFFDEDFTAKLSGYENPIYDADDSDEDFDPDYYHPGCRKLFQSFLLKRYLSGFTVIFTELLTGEKISYPGMLWEIEYRWTQLGGTSLEDIAKFCFDTCNVEDAESRILKLVKYEKYIPQMAKRSTHHEQY